jgi:preprotein translocase subunit Sss1
MPSEAWAVLWVLAELFAGIGALGAAGFLISVAMEGLEDAEGT